MLINSPIGFDLALTTLTLCWNDVDTKLQKRCLDVVSTLCKVENPTSDFVSFSMSDQCYFNVELQLWNNVSSRLKFWSGREKTQHQLAMQIKWRFIHILMPRFAFVEFLKSMSHFKDTLKQIWKSPYILVSIKKMITWKFCILNPKNSGIISSYSLNFSQKVGYFLTYSIVFARLSTNISQTLRVNNARTVRDRNASFSGYYFYMNTNI